MPAAPRARGGSCARTRACPRAQGRRLCPTRAVPSRVQPAHLSDRRRSTRAPLPYASCWALTRPSCLHGRSEVCGDSGAGEGRWLPAPPRATAAVHQAPAPNGCVRRIVAVVAHRGTDCPHACAAAHVCTRPDPGREDRPQQRHAVLRRLLGAGVGLQDCRRHAVPCYPAACPQRCHMHACGFALRCPRGSTWG